MVTSCGYLGYLARTTAPVRHGAAGGPARLVRPQERRRPGAVTAAFAAVIVVAEGAPATLPVANESGSQHPR